MNYCNPLKQIRRMTCSRSQRLLVILLLLASTVGCDQASKHLARTQLSQLGSVTMPGGFLEFSLAENPGAFLSLGAALPESLRVLLLTLGVGLGLSYLFMHLMVNPKLNSITFLGLGLVGAGGVSNLLDRVLRHGRVTDFAILKLGSLHTGIFNWADFVVMVGIGVVIVSLQLRPKQAGV
jgi:signal peptidase II